MASSGADRAGHGIDQADTRTSRELRAPVDSSRDGPDGRRVAGLPCPVFAAEIAVLEQRISESSCASTALPDAIAELSFAIEPLKVGELSRADEGGTTRTTWQESHLEHLVVLSSRADPWLATLSVRLGQILQTWPRTRRTAHQG
jgi:hypothetical protein